MNLPTITDVRRRHARERKAMLSRQANELRRLRQARAAAKKAAAKKAHAKKASAKKAHAKKAAAKKAHAKKASAKKVPAKKASAKKVPAKKVLAKKVLAKKVPAKKAHAKKASAKKPSAKKASAKKAPQDVQLLVSAVAQYGRGALVPVRILRRQLGLTHSQFDAAAKSALASGQLIAHHHDHPESLSVSDRLAMLRVGRTYYIGMALPT